MPEIIRDDTIIEFDGVTKSYPNGTRALEDVNIKINRGEFAFFVGPSGAGKSTFMKLILREEKPTAGRITVNGYDLNSLKSRQVAEYRRTLGIVFQDFRLIPTMDAFENVAFALHVTGASNREIRKLVSGALGVVGLREKAHCKPPEMSGGEQQRVALARALVNKPDLLVADEPTGNVDPNMSYAIVELLREINRRGTTVLMVTHEHQLVSDFGGRVIMIEKGHIASDGEQEGRL